MECRQRCGLRNTNRAVGGFEAFGFLLRVVSVFFIPLNALHLHSASLCLFSDLLYPHLDPALKEIPDYNLLCA